MRVAIDQDGAPTVSRYLPGRGAWLCKHSASCFNLAVRHRAFDRALRTTFAHDQLSLLFDQIFRPISTEPEGCATAGEASGAKDQRDQ